MPAILRACDSREPSERCFQCGTSVEVYFIPVDSATYHVGDREGKGEKNELNIAGRMKKKRKETVS